MKCLLCSIVLSLFARLLGTECMWHVTFSDPNDLVEGSAYVCLFTAGSWDSLAALNAAVANGTFSDAQAAVKLRISEGVSDNLFMPTIDSMEFFRNAVYVVFSSPTIEASRYFETGRVDGMPDGYVDQSLLPSYLVGYIEDDDGTIHDFVWMESSIALTGNYSRNSATPEPSSVLLLLVGAGLLGLKRNSLRRILDCRRARG